MIIDDIRKDLFAATKAGEKKKAAIYQIAVAALKNAEIEKDPGEKLTEDEEVAVLRKEVSKLEDSIESFEKGDREDLVEESKMQKEALEKYLPDLMSEEEIEDYVQKKKEALGIADMSGFGKLMGVVMSELKGKADGSAVKSVVEDSLK